MKRLLSRKGIGSRLKRFRLRLRKPIYFRKARSSVDAVSLVWCMMLTGFCTLFEMLLLLGVVMIW